MSVAVVAVSVGIARMRTSHHGDEYVGIEHVAEAEPPVSGAVGSTGAAATEHFGSSCSGALTRRKTER